MLKIEVVIRGKLKMNTPEFESALSKIADKWHTTVLENFLSGGRPHRWAPLKSDYLKRKLREGYPSAPLLRTGEMFESITKSYGKDWVKISTDSEVALYHHVPGRRTDLPARPFFVLMTEDIAYAEKLLAGTCEKIVEVVK